MAHPYEGARRHGLSDAGTFTEVDQACSGWCSKPLPRVSTARDIWKAITDVTFEEQGARTRLTVKASAKGFHPAAPQMLAGMDAGWSQSLEKLEALVGAMAK